ncbi:histidine phosphatase family protein [Oryzihumus leptocrescens]|uniref:Broad specificity phosphatase PhoE n=1 Tax=Oryzihumus leptocrescens TaxID=297536 RepID=A0A542ZN54_9MICO|nr:histidine phosphatase family protein [Oryzihumus leptocrescens]TQL61727.1 broad specificity phosphatase PhoE [Oryzihumus leptocrescens]
MTPQMSSTGVRTVVHVMRHGEVHNPTGVLYGRLPDFHLSELGRDMAQAVADHLAGHDVTHVVASSLDRAQETATPIAAVHELAIHTDDRVIEAGNHFEGRTFGVGDGSLRHPEHWPKLLNPFRPSWGEPYAEIAARMVAAVTDARAVARGHEAVIVSHQLPVWTLRNKLEGKRLWHDPRKRQCALASLTTLSFLGDQLESISYSEPAGALLAHAARKAGA